MNAAMLAPIRAKSLKEAFLERFEALILSGSLEAGTRLPPERELAATLGVSRPVVHEGLLELARRGLVELRPRHGARVCDYRRQASLALLQSLFGHHVGPIEPRLLFGLLDLRCLVEVEGARLAALHRTADEVADLRRLCAIEEATGPDDVDALVRIDFEFHHRIAVSSGNPVLPMVIRSFQPAFANLGGRFYRRAGVVPVVRGMHRSLVDAIGRRDAHESADLMRQLLAHGAEALRTNLEARGGAA